MTLRRYAPIAPSRGTVIRPDIRQLVASRDGYCVCDRAGFPTEVQARCAGSSELDHVRGSGALGLKSASTPDNLVVLSAWCHRWKTEHGRQARPLLLAYLERVGDPHSAHVDPCSATCRGGTKL